MATRKIAAAAGAPRAVADWRDLLMNPAIDAVYIATPPFLHREMSIAALQSGKHVCCEKPFVITQADVRAVMAVHATVPHLKFTCNASRFHESGVARTAREGGQKPLLLDVFRCMRLVVPCWGR